MGNTKQSETMTPQQKAAQTRAANKAAKEAAAAAEANVMTLDTSEGIEVGGIEDVAVVSDIEVGGGRGAGMYEVNGNDPTVYLPKSLIPFVTDPTDNEAFMALYASANVKLNSGNEFNVIENALLCTGMRSIHRALALLPATDPQGTNGFAVAKDTAARSYVHVFEGTDPNVPLSGYVGLKPAIEYGESDGDKVIVHANDMKNRVIVSQDGKTMTCVCGGRTTLSWGKTKETQVYVNFGAAAQELKMRTAELFGRARHINAVAKRMAWVAAVSREHSIEREAHLLAYAGLKNVYYGRPKGSKDTAKSGLQAQLAFVIDPRVLPSIANGWKAEHGTWMGVDLNIG